MAETPMSELHMCDFGPFALNNYLIAGNRCNAFVLGEVGSQNDFFLVGAQPEDESPYPLLTGNILDSEGHVLFRLVRNVLVINPGHCSRVFADRTGYEIHDSAGQPIMKVNTRFQELRGYAEKSFVTTISASFYNAKGEIVFQANSGEPGEHIASAVKTAFGFSGGFGLVSRLTEDELLLAQAALISRGAIHQLLTGRFHKQDIVLDGKALVRVNASECTLRIHTGDFLLLRENVLSECRFLCSGPAENLRLLFGKIGGGQT